MRLLHVLMVWSLLSVPVALFVGAFIRAGQGGSRPRYSVRYTYYPDAPGQRFITISVRRTPWQRFCRALTRWFK